MSAEAMSIEDWANTISAALTTLAAIGGLTVALLWRCQYFAQKRLETQEDTYIKSLDYLDALGKELACAVLLHAEESESQADRWRSEVEQRRQEIEPQERDFLVIKRRAMLYLDAVAKKILDDIWECRGDILAAHIEHALFLEHSTEAFKDSHKKAGIEAQKHVEALRERVKNKFERST